MKRTMAVLALAAFSTCLLNAQFGLGKIKDKLDAGKSKAKPVSDRAERARKTSRSGPPRRSRRSARRRPPR